MNYTQDDVKEAIEYIVDVGPGRALTKRILEEGPTGDEYHRITGDDLAGFLYHLSVIAHYHGVSIT